ncbi:MAG: hypothetical protein ACYDB2_09370 [Acidimicrobiales bacterium]
MTSGFDWNQNRVVHVERPDAVTINDNVVRATSDLDADRFVGQLQGCCHLEPNGWSWS